MKKVSFAAGLRHKVVLQKKTLVSDNAGGFETTWEDAATLWCAIERVRGQEKMQSGQLSAISHFRFRFRYTRIIEAETRLLWGTRVFNIRTIDNIGEKNIAIEAYAEEGVGI